MKKSISVMVVVLGLTFVNSLQALPELKFFELDKTKIKSGETVKVTAKVEDDKAGVAVVQIWYKTSPVPVGREGISYGVSMRLNEETGLYEYEFKISEFAP
ncbi:MAG: hypothetical protein HYS98_04965, partial [Deltaproteobacteria bacterium]|nr:hypothetical protein [Deltaproteobacteria bacterium]